MKTYHNLYPQVWNFENLYLAWRKARAPSRPSPIFKYEKWGKEK